MLWYAVDDGGPVAYRRSMSVADRTTSPQLIAGRGEFVKPLREVEAAAATGGVAMVQAANGLWLPREYLRPVSFEEHG